MRLEKIYIGGFKSFANTLSIDLRGQMLGIVGPNGCGKSNIVDAVRWVLGAASRHIRAANPEDVIFNGTANRKPVGQAFVELIFDNAAGKYGAQYAQYGEISIRRTVLRNRESKYHINGRRCRRKDIADIFFGTGLAGNSYAIIEQGMISRIIEAKPEEMRSYIEEAAGVSRYKERRRETERRIGHTRDNLERVMDIREEINKQLHRLQRQARDAKRYTLLKEEKNILQAGLLLLQLRHYESEQDNVKKVLFEKQLDFDNFQTSIQAVEAKIEHQRMNLQMADNQLHAAKEAQYRLDAKIVYLESEMAAQEQNVKLTEQEREEIQTELRNIAADLQTERERCRKLEDRAAELRASRQQTIDAVTSRQESIEAIEKRLHDLRAQRDRHHGELRDSSEKLRIEKARGEMYKQSLEEIDKSANAVSRQYQAINLPALQSERKDNMRRLKNTRHRAGQNQRTLDQARADVKRLRENARVLNERLGKEQAQAQEVRGHISSLEVLQEAQLGHDAESFHTWLRKAGLSGKNLVSRNIVVEHGWEDAVETVLGAFVGGITVDALEQQVQKLSSFSQGTLVLLEREQAPSVLQHATLADRISGNAGLHDWLLRVRCADDIAEAMAMRKSLGDGESVVTCSGVWIGKSWLQMRRFGHGDEGILVRRSKITSLHHRLKSLRISTDTVKHEMRQTHESLSAQEEIYERNRERQLAYLKEITVLESAIALGEEQIEQQSAQSKRLERLQADISLRRRQLTAKHRQSQQDSDKAQTEIQKTNSRFEQLSGNIVTQEDELLEMKSLFQQACDASHRAEIEGESVRVGCIASQRHIEQLQHYKATLEQRRVSLLESVQCLTAPLADSRQQYDQLLRERFDAGEQLTVANQRVSEERTKISQLEDRRNSLCKQFEVQRKAKDEAHTVMQVNVARRDDAKAAFEKFGVDIDVARHSLSSGVTLETQAMALQETEEKIKRLGAINLVAMDEFDELKERQSFIDSQCDDLTAALENLEAAMLKIDQETRRRFRETFDRINDNLRKLFPALFGGGKAYLEMLEDDLLDSGITIMVKPKGKRLSTIKLMSGGEKALAAIAVVFSIFKLNPAPFCFLDEVDAALDENNIERFCQVLKGMSDSTQFSVITHNKLTMEYMNSLIGITMHEPGVSSLVSVDIDAAFEMASA